MKATDGTGVRGVPAIGTSAHVAICYLPSVSIVLSTISRTNLQVLSECTQLQLKKTWKQGREKTQRGHLVLLPPMA